MSDRTLVAEMTRVYDDIAKAAEALRQARDTEVNAKHEYESRRRQALLSKDRPKVSRDGWTVAERDAWVEEECAGDRLAYDLATVRRESAADHLRTLRDQSLLIMAIAKARQAEMALSGVA